MNTENYGDTHYALAGLGELLWDAYPSEKSIGGAPANFAWHCSQLGAKSWPLSCLGVDPLGDELFEQLSAAGMDLSYVQRASAFPTGRVDVLLHSGKPTYEIHANVAWDHISFTPAMEDLTGRLDGVCFGTLAQRSSVSRTSIHRFLVAMPTHALKIFDVNLRQSDYSKELIEASLKMANVLKLSDEELLVLREMFELEGGVLEQLRQLVEVFDLRLVAYTRGIRGSLLCGVDGVHDFPGRDCRMVDTVGAGDSFTAALSIGLLRGWSLKEVNCFANEVASFVCSQKGATPELPDFLNTQSLKNLNPTEV